MGSAVRSDMPSEKLREHLVRHVTLPHEPARAMEAIEIAAGGDLNLHHHGDKAMFVLA